MFGGRAVLTVPALGAALVWSSSFLGIRAVAGELSAGPLALGRLTVAALCLGLVVWWRAEPLPARGVLVRIGLIGVLWFAAYNVLLNRAETIVDAGTAALTVGTAPLMVAVGAHLFLGERVRATTWLGGAVAVAGIVIMGVPTAGARVDRTGIILCLLAALGYAASVLIQRPLLTTTSGLAVTWLATVCGAVACLPYAGGLAYEAAHASPHALGWLIYLGVGPTALGFAPPPGSRP